jgi:DNA-binding XRE family transcriptional regulator
MSIVVKENPVISALNKANQIPAAIRTIKESGVSKTALAKYLGVGRDTLWTWEKGIYHPPLVLAEIIFTLADSAKQQSQHSRQ